MPIFMIHKRAGNTPDGKSIPLLWGLDEETRSRIGHDAAMLYGFPERKDAETVMAEVQNLFDMDDAPASTLHIVEYEPKS